MVAVHWVDGRNETNKRQLCKLRENGLTKKKKKKKKTKRKKAVWARSEREKTATEWWQCTGLDGRNETNKRQLCKLRENGLTNKKNKKKKKKKTRKKAVWARSENEPSYRPLRREGRRRRESEARTKTPSWIVCLWFPTTMCLTP